MFIRQALAVVFLLIIASTGTMAAAGLSDPLFASDTPLEVTIRAPFEQLLSERSTDDYLPATLSYADADGRPFDFNIGIRTRGHLRNKEAVCPFAPLRVNFKKSQTDNTAFDHQDKLKLVTHCRSRSSQYEQAVLAEYLTYRMFNALTDKSFKVRLLRVRYEYTDAERSVESWAFVIEHEKRMQRRLGMKRARIGAVDISQVDATSLALSSLFEFFVGNTDFSPFAATPGQDCCHNYALFENEQFLYVPIPFDFDQSGIVNAPYAKPNPRFGLRSVQQRLYRGRCAHNDLLEPSLNVFRERREAIEALIDEAVGLTDSRRRSMRRYIQSFYKLIDDPKDVERQLLTKCI